MSRGMPMGELAVSTLVAGLACCTQWAGEAPAAPAEAGAATEPAASVSKELRAYIARPDTEIAVGHGALLICREEYPSLDVNSNLEQLAAIGRRLSAELSKAEPGARKLDALGRFLFETEKYELPKEDKASDFLLCDVLKRKRGNCLGLSVLCLALAERANLQLHGVPVPSRLTGPGHLLVRYDDGKTRLNFDPTERGAAHPDDYYRKLFGLPADGGTGVSRPAADGAAALANASRKEVLSILLVNLAGARIEAGRSAAALPLLEQALALTPSLATVHNNLGAAHLRLGNLRGAEQAYQKALALRPGMAAPRLGLSEIALYRGNVDAAEKEITAVLAEEPANVQAHCLLASVHLARQEYRAAITLLQAAAEAAPRDMAVRCNLGRVRCLAGDFAEAEQAYREALVLNPDSADAHSGLGSVLRATAQTEQGDAEFAAALKLDPNHVPTLLAQAIAAQHVRDFAAAEALYDKVLKTQPYHLQALSGLSEALLAQKKVAQAAQRLAAAVKAHPGNVALAMLLAETRMATGDFAGALAGLQEALGKATEPEKPALLRRIGVCYGKLQNHRKAYDAAEQLLKLSPRDVAGLRISAAACEGLQNRQKAIEFYRRILELEPDDVHAKTALTRLQAK
ncbi:MAG: tetratricopeptide repeat protein [Planctomycetota bacterium]|nr:tetratricopeptide repeat protein [Planctomycetota bacterium]